MRPVSVEVVAYTPTEFFHCMHCEVVWHEGGIGQKIHAEQRESALPPDRKSTRLNSSHRCISYAVFCLKKKKVDFDSKRDQKEIDSVTPGLGVINTSWDAKSIFCGKTVGAIYIIGGLIYHWMMMRGVLR